MFKHIQDFSFEGVDLSALRIDDLLSSPLPYELGLPRYLEYGGTHSLFNAAEYFEHSQTKPIKVEGIERLSELLYSTSLRLGRHFNHTGPVSCHMFISPAQSLSFPMHSDTDDVIIYMVSGRKVYEGVDGSLEVRAGDSIYIPRGTLHCAVNTDDSVMLSFGLERYLEDKL
jgi:mannose-6-phosphate isomerase-like protein (cupin superfamily)